MALLLGLMVAICVGSIALALWLSFATKRGSDDVVRRLDSVEKARRRGQQKADVQLLRSDLLSDVPALHRFLLRWRATARLQQFLLQAGVRTKPGKLIVVSILLGVAAWVMSMSFGGNVLVHMLFALTGAAIPTVFLLFKFSQRLRKFEKHFPDALDLLQRAVRAGHAFTTGLEMVAKEMPEPLASEFRTLFEEQNFGLPLKDALLNLADRVPSIDVRFFVTALLIQKDTGGNLAEILANLSGVIRERFQIYGEVRARTAQGKLTALILIALPVMVMLIMRSVNPDYIKPLFEDPWGPYMLGTAAMMQTIGSAILWKIVHIEV